MLLESILRDPVRSLVHLERYVNGGSPSGFTFTHSTSLDTCPHLGPPSFELPYIEIESTSLLTEGDPSLIPAPLQTTRDGYLRYPIHPDILPIVKSQLPQGVGIAGTITVTPTASMRTVQYSGAPSPFFMKLHYPMLIGRFSRANPFPKWKACFENAEELSNHLRAPNCPKSFAMLRPTSGLLLAADPHRRAGMGMIYREFWPHPRRPGSSLIPFFSLFAKDSRAVRDPLLLTQLLDRTNNPVSECLKRIVIPLLECFRFQAGDLGLLPEYNAQNVLLELTEDLEDWRLIHRDMMGTFKDLPRRRELGLHSDFSAYHAITTESPPDELFQRRSFAYDFKLGEYIFAELEECLSQYYAFSPNEFRERVRAEFHRIVVVNQMDYFGSETHWWRYPNTLLDGKRPYIRCRSPKYR